MGDIIFFTLWVILISAVVYIFRMNRFDEEMFGVPLFLFVAILLIASLAVPLRSTIIEASETPSFVDLGGVTNAAVRYEKHNYIIQLPPNFEIKNSKLKLKQFRSFFNLPAHRELFLESAKGQISEVVPVKVGN